MRKLLALTLLAALMAAGGCSAGQGLKPSGKDGSTVLASYAKPAAVEAGQADSALAAPINGFGFDLLRSLEKNPQRGRQTVISPLSVHADLSMVANGASGDTLKQMRATLAMAGLGEQASNAAYSSGLSRLESSTDATVAIANSLWVQRGFPVERPFIGENQKSFGAELRSLDLHTAQAVTDINSWVAAATHGKIAKLLDATPPAQTVMYVINATYFNADWASPFEAEATHDLPFHAPAGDVSVPTMGATRQLPYAQTADYQAVRLPYSGDQFSMLVMLPSKTSSLDQLVGSLNAGSFAQVLGGLAEKRVALALPKAEVTWDGSLGDNLKAMGMGSAFSPETADFSRMSASKGLYIGEVVHKTYLRVDEKGTEAAAVTSSSLAGAMAPVTPQAQMVVDRPYLMALVDNRSGAILFLSTVRDPRAGK